MIYGGTSIQPTNKKRRGEEKRIPLVGKRAHFMVVMVIVSRSEEKGYIMEHPVRIPEIPRHDECNDGANMYLCCLFNQNRKQRGRLREMARHNVVMMQQGTLHKHLARGNNGRAERER